MGLVGVVIRGLRLSMGVVGSLEGGDMCGGLTEGGSGKGNGGGKFLVYIYVCLCIIEPQEL